MAVNEQFNIEYTARDSASAATDALIRRVRELDAAVAKVKADLAGFASGGGRSSAAMTRQVEKLNAALAAMKGQLQGVNAQLGQTPGPANDAGLSFGRVGVALAGMLVAREVEQVLAAVGDGLRKAREESERLAESNLKLRDSMRELANLQGHEGPDDRVAGDALLLGMASGLKPDEAVKFLEQFEGSIPAGREKGNIAPGKGDKDREALEREMAKEGAAFGARVGLAPATAGDISGVVSQYTKINKVEDFAGQLGALAYGLNEGRGKIDLLSRSELGAAGGSIGDGRTADLAELGAFIGVASTVSKSAGSAGTKYTQASDVLNSVGGPQGEYLQRIGAKGVRGDLAKLRLLKADLDANAGGDRAGYLHQQGFHNKVGVRSAIALANNLDVLEQRIAKARAMAADGGATMALDRDFLGKTITGRKRQAEAALASAGFVQGKPGESVNVAREFAEARLKASGRLDTRYTNALDDFWNATVGGVGQRVGGHVDAKRMRINEEVLRGADAEAQRVGVKGVDPRVYKRTNRQEDVDAAYRDVEARIRAKGGDATGGMTEVAAGIKRLVSFEEDKQRQRQAPPAPAPPPLAPKGAPAPGRP